MEQAKAVALSQKLERKNASLVSAIIAANRAHAEAEHARTEAERASMEVVELRMRLGQAHRERRRLLARCAGKPATDIGARIELFDVVPRNVANWWPSTEPEANRTRR